MALSIEITSNNKGAVEGFKQVRESAKQTQQEVTSSFQKVEGEISSASRKVGEAVKKTTEQLRQQIDETESRINSLTGRIKAKEAQIGRLKELNKSLRESNADPLRIGASDYGIKKAEGELENLKKQLSSATEESIALGKQLDNSGSVEKFARLSTQISQAKTEMARLVEEGKQGTEEYEKLVQKVNDLQEAAKNVNLDSSNGAGFNVFAEGVNAASGGLTAITGALSLFNVNSETAAQVQAKLQSVMSISLGIQQLMSLTYQDSAVRLKALAMWKRLVVAATGEEAAANTAAAASTGALAASESAATGATITFSGAMRALGVAIKSVPILGWVAAIGGGAVVAISKYISRLKQAREENEKLHAQKMERTWEALNTPVKNAAKRYADARVELESLLGVARDANVPLEKQREAYEALDKAIPGFNSALDATASGYESNTSALYKYLGALETLYKYEAAKDYLKSLYEQEIALETNQRQFESWVTNRERLLRIAEQDADKFVGKSTFNMAGSIAGANMGGDAGVAAQLARGGVNIAQENLDTANRALSGVTKKLTDLRSQIKIVEGTVKGLAADASTVKPFDTNSPSTSPSRGGSGGGYANDDTAERLRREREDAERLAELRANQALYAERDARDQELARWQAEIDAMDEGLEKKLQQIKLNYAKEEEAIKREQEDLILQRRDDAKALWEAENPESVRNGETWQSSGAAANYKGGLNASDDAYFKARTEANNKQLETSTRDLFKGLIDQYQDYTAERLAIEKKFNDDISALMAARKQAEERGDDAELIRINGAIDTATKSRNAKLQSTDAQKWAKDNGLDAFFGNLSGQSGKALRAMRDRLNARSENATGDEKADLQRRAKEIDDALMTRRIGNAQYASQQAGEAADLVSKLDEQGIFGGGDASKRIGAAFSAAASAGEAYAKFMQGDFVGALSSGLDAVLDLFTVFGIGEGNMAELQEEIDHLTGATQDLTQAFSKLKENLDESNTLTARENYEKAKANVMQREQNMRQTMSDRLRQWERGSRSLGSKVNRNSSAQSALAQMGLSSIYDLTSLSPERIQQLATEYAGGAWTMLMDALRDANSKHNGDAEAFMEELMQYAGLTEELEGLTDTFKEIVTGISFEGFKGNFVSMLQDLSKDIDDFAADTEDQFNKISVQRIADNYEGELRALYDDWAEAAEDGLTEDERRSLEAQKAAIAQRALDERQAAIASGLISTSAERKAGSTKGFGSMNSEQADELNGRFTALQVSNQGILNSVVQSAASLAAMSGSFSASAETLQSLQMLAVARNSHLEDISAFCKNISARVDAIEGYSKTTSEKL